ncbi:hypothetical protein [Wolbachia endosymbiont of Psylliodes chrysocephala]|nr:hypothetical protein [Wolbachia endosymbiont of Psylliodes chrysocephala]
MISAYCTNIAICLAGGVMQVADTALLCHPSALTTWIQEFY